MSLTALQIANSIAKKVINMDAQVDGAHPILSEIYDEMTSEQRILCGKEAWTFLNDTIDIDVFDVSATQAQIIAGYYMSEATGLRTSYGPSKTEYYAQRITTPSDKLSKVNSVSINLKIGSQGIGAPSGAISLTICPDINGSPDLLNPVMTADALTLALQGTLWAEHLFLFTGTDTVLLKNTSYWVVFKWIGAADNGDSMFVAADATDTAAVTMKTRLNGAATWTVQTGYKLATTLTYYEADYIQEVDLPANVAAVDAMYSGNNTTKTVNLLPYSGDEYIRSGEDLPVDTFTVRTAAGGILTVYFNPSAKTLTLTLECKIRATAITADSDTSVIPDDSIDWLIYQCAGNFIDRGLGVTGLGAQVLWAKAEAIKIDMEFRYLDKSKGFKAQRVNRNIRRSFDHDRRRGIV